jgi:hypothetical protein
LVANGCQPVPRSSPLGPECWAILAIEVRIKGYREIYSRRGEPHGDGDGEGF